MGLYIFGAYFCVFVLGTNKVFSVYCTLSKTDKSSINEEDFRFKWNFMWQKQFKIYWNSSFIQYKLCLYFFFFFSFLCVFVPFLLKYAKTYFFLWTIYIRLCWRHVHNCQNNEIFGHKQIVISSKLLVLVLEPNLEQDSFCMFMNRMEISSKSDTLPFMSQ